LDRTVSESGFDAKWRISYLGRNYAQSWISGVVVRKAIEESRFGVEMVETDRLLQDGRTKRQIRRAFHFAHLRSGLAHRGYGWDSSSHRFNT
jgi:inner membrane protein involved in colicin E2 resistance